MNTTATIAVIIPTFNHASILRRTLEALTLQTLPAAEVVVVDDGSTDDPETVVKEFLPLLPISFVRLRHNHGAPFARNEGARLTSSSLLLFLDADAELVPDALEVFKNTLQMHPEASFVYSNFLWGRKRFTGQPFDRKALERRNYIHTTSLMRREDFYGFDERLKKFQDWDLWLTLTEKGKIGVWINQDLFRVEPRKQGMSRWLPRIAYRIPWQKLGFQPKEIGRYRDAELIIRNKHHI